MRFFCCTLLVICAIGCAHFEPVSTPESRRESRLSAASTGLRCDENTAQLPDQSCVTPAGLVWSACAWNACGRDPSCRRPHEIDVLATSCGGREFMSCDVPEDVRRAQAAAEIAEVSP